MSLASWVPTSISTVYGLTAANRPVTDIDGGPLGTDPALPRGAVVTTPTALSDPSMSPIGSAGSPYGKWGSTVSPQPVTLTYSFYETGGPAVATGGITPAPLSAARRDAIRSALASVADVANIRFVEIAETATGGPTTSPGASGALVGQLRFVEDTQLESNPTTASYAFGPSSTVLSSGFVAFDADRSGIPDDMSRGGSAYAVTLREIGRALGLTNSFDAGDALASAGDPRAVNGAWHTGWTMMSNTAPSGGTFNPIGPMIADIQVLQSWYGANWTTRTGNDVYKIDGSLPTAAIWDAGGTDTIDASGATAGLAIDLNPGEFGRNLSIAKGVSIENVIGGAGNDTIFGTNSMPNIAADGTFTVINGNNRLDGGAGNDTIMGLDGDDTLIGGLGENFLDGGLGTDTAVYTVASSDVAVATEGNALILNVPALGITDRLSGIEYLSFTDRTIAASDAPAKLPKALFSKGVLGPMIVEPPGPIDPPIDPSRRLAVWCKGIRREVEMKAYSGPVSWLKNMHIGENDSEAMRGTSQADFINTVGGDDAIDGDAGDDVLDGGVDSNFLTGGSGNDTFFVDGRSSGVTWSTVTDLEKGEWVTAWGWKNGVSKLTWAEMSGAEGYKGATAHIDLDTNGTIDMSMTITGKSSGSILVTPGQVNGTDYLAFTLR
ncbi:M10 family metallopeptidase C-terminal domain-containing protein [Azospirillum sp. sgz302134]